MILTHVQTSGEIALEVEHVADVRTVASPGEYGG